ncbi:MAG: TonB-dependent receptor [Gammaproteobacteria bacterium]|nr:MAG: TonB-dependent receptor [Gammaproteobacteria bacterium]
MGAGMHPGRRCTSMKALSILGGLGLLVCSTACADQLEPLVVSATRFELHGVATAASIDVIDREEIERSGARHLGDLLRGQGGVQVSDQTGDGSRAIVSMRGFGANAAANTLILVDGRRLNNTDLRAPDLNVVSLQDIERIEIIQGSAGTLFGDQAVGGVINIITRRPRGAEGEVQLELGSHDRQVQRLYAGRRLDNGLGLRLSLERRWSDNYRENNQLRYYNGRVRADWEHASGVIFLEHYQAVEDLELPGGLFADELAADRRQSTHPGDFNDTRTWNSRAGLDQELFPDWRLLAEFTHRRVETGALLTGFALRQRRVDRSFNPRLVGRRRLGSGDLLLTAGGDIESHDYRLTSAFGLQTNAQTSYSAYLQVVLPLTEAMSLTGGMRKAWVRNDLFDSFAFPAGLRADDQQFAGSIGLSWTPAPAWRLFLRRDGNYRFPLVDEQTNTAAGVKGLKTQTGWSVETGLEWTGSGRRLKVLGYRLKLDNEIDFDPSLGFGFCCNTNLDPTMRTGAIVEGDLSLGPASLSMRYNYIDAEFRSGTFAGRRVPLVARHQLRIDAGWQATPALGLRGELLAIGDRFAAGDMANDSARLPGYAVVNLHADYRWRSLRGGVRVDNLLDREYSDFAARTFRASTFSFETGFYPMPERTLSLYLDYALP